MKRMLRFPTQKKSVSENDLIIINENIQGAGGGILEFRSFSKQGRALSCPSPTTKEKSLLCTREVSVGKT